ncbi:hypothetical protein ACTFIW_011569 [Dictyostelium discoideum]
MSDSSSGSGSGEHLNRYNANDNAFVVTLVINCVVMLIFFLIFCIVRRKFKQFYQYRFEQHHKGVSVPPSDGFFSWVVDTIKYSDNSIKDTAGLDGFMYLRNVKTSFYICVVLMVISSVMLYPTNYYGKYNEHREKDEDGKLPDEVVGLTMISMGNIERGSHLLWVHLVFVFFVTIVVLWFSYQDYHLYSKERIQYKQQSRLSNYTIMLRDIPNSMFTREELSNYFKSHLSNPSDLLDVSLQYPAPHIYALVSERENFVKKYESAIESYRRTKEKPTTKIGFLGCFGEEKDSIDYFQEKIDELTKKIEYERAEAETGYYIKNANSNVGGSSFVIFNQRKVQKEMVQTIMHAKYHVLFSRYYAPDPNDVFWKNIHIGLKSYYVRSLIVAILTFALVFLWGIPVAFLSGFSNLETISRIKAFSWITDIISKSKVLQGFLSGFLPNLILIIFMILLIPIIYALSRACGYFSNSRIEASVFSKYFLFLVFNVFLVSAIAGTIFQSIEQIANDPTSIIGSIANSLGGLSFQMINYILIAAAGSFGAILRIVGLIIQLIKLKWLAKTKRQIDDTLHQGPFAYGVNYAKNLLILQLTLAYSTLSPFILIFGAWYFGLSYIVQKYNIIWVNTPNYQCGGFMSPMHFRRTIIGLLIYHILMIGTFNVYKFYYGILVIICLVVTIVFWYFAEYKFKDISKSGIMDQYQKQQADGTNSGDIEMKASSSSVINDSTSLNPTAHQEFHDASHSISEYNSNSYKPPYYELMKINNFDLDFPIGGGSANV